MRDEMIEKGQQLVKELSQMITELSDEEAGKLLLSGVFNDLLNAIFDPTTIQKYPTIGEMLLINKHRLTFLALLRHALNISYSFESEKDGKQMFVSPSFMQFFEDGVMFLVSEERWSGYIGLFRNNEESFAIATRDTFAGEDMGPDHFEFISPNEFEERLKTIPPTQISDLEKPVKELRELLEKGEADESKYQDLIERYPWILGAQYASVVPHIKLNESNIPDFLALRVHDRFRDIIEIKQPFTTIFRADGTFHSEFNDACNQVERYIDFVRENKDYLFREKGLKFDKPKCYLLIGYQLDEDGMKKIRIKGRNNPAIEILTYDDLIVFATSTINFIRALKAKE